MSVAVIDYGSGNLHSAAKALERVGGKIHVTSDPDVVRKAERIVLPGVGAFKDCALGLRAVTGMWDTLEDEVMRKAKPFLGICVGMQLMATRGLEHDVTDGFGWIVGDVVKLAPSDATESFTNSPLQPSVGLSFAISSLGVCSSSLSRTLRCS